MGATFSKDRMRFEDAIAIGAVNDALKITAGKNTSKKELKTKKKTTPIDPIYVKIEPTANQTNGIEPFYVRLCATISAFIYNDKNSISEFQDLDKGYGLGAVNLKEPPKVLLYDDNQVFESTNPPFVVVLAGKKMILAWRGSSTPMDWIRDFGFFIASSFRWQKVAKVVNVQGAYLALVESNLSKHGDKILEYIREHGVTELLLTGHSLGGGVAQVAHLWFEGTMDPDIDPAPNEWKKLRKQVGLTVRTISFEGPMTTVYVESKTDPDMNQKGIDFINKCGANMVTTCYSMDPVPRMYGEADFSLSILQNFAINTGKRKCCLGDFGNEQNLLEKQQKLIENLLLHTKAAQIGQSINVASQYQHIGNVLYYATPEAEPQVYIDNPGPHGILNDKERNTSDLPQFRDIKYVETNKDVLEAVIHNHMFIVTGPGLTLSWQPFFATN